MTPKTIDLSTTNTTPTTEYATEYPQVQALLHGVGGGAWMRELSLTLALAAQAHVTLDEQTLIYSDVHDLMALEQRLRAAQRG